MNRKILALICWTAVFLILLFMASLFSISSGPAHIPLNKITQIFMDGRGSAEYSILFDIRLPRLILAISIGGALSLAGVLLQGMFRNPLVEPYTLGISGGAALGICVNIVFKLTNSIGIMSLPLSGFIGAAIIVALVYFLSVKRGILRVQGLLLCGVMISFISSSLIMLLMAISREDDLHGIIFWIMGSLDQSNWGLIRLSIFSSLAILAASYLYCHKLNALSLGEEEAYHLGVDVERTKRVIFTMASLLTGISVSAAGIIGFVGLVVPHFVRMILGEDHRVLIICSFLCGAIFLIFCDSLSRIIIAPMELPTGVITGILGGMIFLYSMSAKKLI